MTVATASVVSTDCPAEPGPTAGASAACAIFATATGIVFVTFTHYMTAGTTSATTFKVRAGADGAGTTTTNGGAGMGRFFGGVMASSITITEIVP